MSADGVEGITAATGEELVMCGATVEGTGARTTSGAGALIGGTSGMSERTTSGVTSGVGA